MPDDLHIPPALYGRIRTFVRLRRAITAAKVLWISLAATGGLLLLAIGLDHLLMLPASARLALRGALVLPMLVGAVWLLHWWLHDTLTDADLRSLDNGDDDMRAAMNLHDRIAAGEVGINRGLAEESAHRAARLEQVKVQVPFITREQRFAAILVLALSAVALIGLLAVRVGYSDLHTVALRYLQPTVDVGSVGARKFQVAVEVWENPAVKPSTATDDATSDSVPPATEGAPKQQLSPDVGAAAGEPDGVARKRRDWRFLRETLSGSTWQPNPDLPLPTAAERWADRLAGYDPLAVARHGLEVLEGDRLVFRFNAVDERQRVHLDDVEFERLEGSRRVPIRFQQIDDTALLTLDKVQRSHSFQLQSSGYRSPVYAVRMVPRPSPTRLVVFESPPAQYGNVLRQTVIRDRAAEIDQNRISGLPGARLALEFTTPYGDDLDRDESWVQVGKSLRLPLRYMTTRDPVRRAAGEKVWSCEFTLDDSIAAEPKLYLHLVTKDAKFEGEAISNRYDEPFLLHPMEDLAPTVEITMLPGRSHYGADDAFGFRFHYLDDYGIAEIGLEIQESPDSPNASYAPLNLRSADSGDQVRREDDVMQVIDLSGYRSGYLAFSVVVKDVNGQEAKTSPIVVTFSDHFTETLLPKLAGGWAWAWGHNRKNPMKRDPDLRFSPTAKSIDGFRAAIATTLGLIDGSADMKGKALAKLADQLAYMPEVYMSTGGFENQLFAFHHRDYPYYFQRQASNYLAALNGFDGAKSFADVREALGTLAEAKTDEETPASKAAMARLTAARARLATTLDRLDLALAVRTETERRVSLLRVAYFCDVLDRRLAEAEAMFARLQEEAGPLPPDRQGSDPWRDYPQWVMTTAPAFNLRQQAKLVNLRLEGLDRKQAALYEELQRLLASPPEVKAQLDARLVALLNLVAGFGPSIYDVDRSALAEQCRQLSRFVRRGVLAGDSAVYAEIDREIGHLGERAALAETRVAPAMAYQDALAELLEAARDVVKARLKYAVGKPDYKEEMSATAKRNRESRMRTQIEELERQATQILYGETFRKGEDLAAMSADIRQLRESIATTLEWLPDWPSLSSHRPLLERTALAIDAYMTGVEALQNLQRDVETLGGFAPLFAADAGQSFSASPQASTLHTALVALAAEPAMAPAARARVETLRDLRATLPPGEPAADESDAVKKERAKVAAEVSRQAEAQATLSDLLKTARSTLTELAAAHPVAANGNGAAPGNTSDTTEMPTTLAPPHPLISAATSHFLDAMAPEAVLARLNADLATFKGQPALQDAAFEAAVRYFADLSVDAGKDLGGNPLEEYMRGRIALALHGASIVRMEDFARTFGSDNNAEHARVKDYFGGKDHALTPAIASWIDAQLYPTPTLPDDLRAPMQPYVDAFREQRLPAYLSARRTERLTELTALAERLKPLRERYEALVRVDTLARRLNGLLDDLRLYHYDADDIRVEADWAEIAEQAEGLDRDLRAGRLPAIAQADRLVLDGLTGVFRVATPVDVVGEPARFARLQAYHSLLQRLRGELMPVAEEAAQTLAADRPKLQADLAVAMLSGLPAAIWFERQLHAEAEYQTRLLGNLTGIPRIKARANFGSMQPADDLQALSAMTAYAWRSALDFQAHRYVSAPTPAARDGLLHDLSIMTLHKAMPEYYYEQLGERLSRRRYASGNAPDSLAEQMADGLEKGRNLTLEMARYHLSPVPTGLPSRDAARLDQLNLVGAMPVMFKLETDLATFDKARALVYPTSGPAGTNDLRAAVARIRDTADARGAYWLDLGRAVADYLQAGELFLAAPDLASIPAERLTATLARQQADLQRLSDRLASATAAGDAPTPDTGADEHQAVAEAIRYTAAWQTALAADDDRARRDLFAGYRDVHEALVSYLESQRGNLFPDPLVYAKRNRYRHAMHHFGAFDFEAEILGTENRWFHRADTALGEAYATMLDQVYAGLDGQAPAITPTAYAFSRWVDTKYRYLMAYATPDQTTRMPPPTIMMVDETMPEHLTRAFANALTIDLPDQDNRLMRKRYFDALQATREESEGLQK